MPEIDRMVVNESHLDPVISTSNKDDNESNTTPLTMNQSMHLAGMVTTDNSSASSPELLIQTLDASLLKLKQNLAHNRAIFTTKADVVMGKLKEMEGEVNKALQVLDIVNSSQHYTTNDTIPNNIRHSKDPSIIDEHQIQTE